MIKKALLGLMVLLGKKVIAKVVRKVAAKASGKVPPKS
jgi:hypothetical protein